MAEYGSIRVTKSGGIGFIEIFHKSDASKPPGSSSCHYEIGMALNDLRFDNSTRVIVIRSKEHDFFVPPPGRPLMENHIPSNDWDLTQGMHRTYQHLLEIEKPVIARVAGRAAGFGASLAFACDFIVVAQDAVFGSSHLGMGEGEHFPLGRADAGTVPGDGGSVFVPFFMAPPLAREYLWLARQITGAELFSMGCVNRAVPEDQLDSAVSELAQSLLRRPAYALAMSKRAFNRFLVDRFNRSFDLGWSYELLNFYQHGRYRDGRGETTL